MVIMLHVYLKSGHRWAILFYLFRAERGVKKLTNGHLRNWRIDHGESKYQDSIKGKGQVTKVITVVKDSVLKQSIA
jgi:hypothetical protein